MSTPRKRTPGQAAQYQRSYRERRKAAGLCTDCGAAPAEPGRVKCAKHGGKVQSWWKSNPEYGRENQRRIRERRSARSEEQVLADQQRLRPNGLKFCKRRAAHDGPLPLDAFFRSRGEADGLHSACRTCHIETYRKRAEKHWRATGIPFQCTYCGGPYEHVDHVIPRKLGGTDSVDNLVPACARCNQSKNARLLADWLVDAVPAA